MGRVGIVVGAGAALAVAVVMTVAGIGDRAAALPDWQAFVLGVVQGLTELLPVSSSGHLILVPWLGDWTYLSTHEEFNKTFDVALHLGTLIAVVAYFRHDIAVLIVAWWRSVRRRRIETATERVAWFVLVATIPAALVGAAFEDTIDTRLGEPWQIAILMAVFAIVLWVSDRVPPSRETDEIGWRGAIAVGAAQCLSLMPGVSRSGITITASRFLGLDRNESARFAFLLLVPIVFGAAVFKGLKDVVFGTLPPGSWGPFVVGTITSAVTGFFVIWALLGYVRRHTYSLFVVYRLVLAAFILIVIASGARDATF
ncbi:MAG TPA: undecaprenyl-diphosphatase UppP [Gaiellaceae bacterium]|jgi:undecaprenyl-diphosphatase